MTTRVASSADGRYQLLDVFRGGAALAVVAFHSINGLVQQGQSALADLLWNGWAGVYVFFPISGFCILAASHSRRNARTLDFLKRRWRRIFPTYWASIGVVIALTLALAPFSRGSAAALLEPGVGWLSILTLTQTLAGLPQAINPVYWSLCYEEQFYLLIALVMLAGEARRPPMLLAVSVAVAAVRILQVSWLPRGLFVDYWLNFAVGLAVFGWNDGRYGRWWSGAVCALAAVVAAVTGSVDLTISLGVAAVLIALRPFDGPLSRSLALAPLGAVGLFSYSLYLVHVPVAGRVVNFAKRFGEASAWWPVVVCAAMLSSVVVAWIFFGVVERRFLNSRATPAAVVRAPSGVLVPEI